ncbi:MAG TPA: DMT family transporter, partial [Nitrolancea sp.]|nr:DMT family transporter [Nitrolancea sp.]
RINLAYILLGFTMLVWGGSFVAARALLASDDPATTTLTPTVLAALRFVLASVFFIPPLIGRRATKRNATARALSWRDGLLLVGMGQIGIAAYFWLQYTGVRLTNAGIASILVVGLIPLATSLVARRRLGESLRRNQLGGLVLGLLGVGIVVVQGGSVEGVALSGAFLLGALCLIADAGLFAVYSTLVRDLRERFDALTLTAGTTASGAVGLTLLAIVTGGLREIGSLDAWQWVAVIYLALVCSVLAYFCYNRALATIEAGRASTWVYLEPPVALVFGALLLGESISVTSILGGLTILVSVWIVSRAR